MTSKNGENAIFLKSCYFLYTCFSGCKLWNRFVIQLYHKWSPIPKYFILIFGTNLKNLKVAKKFETWNFLLSFNFEKKNGIQVPIIIIYDLWAIWMNIWIFKYFVYFSKIWRWQIQNFHLWSVFGKIRNVDSQNDYELFLCPEFFIFQVDYFVQISEFWFVIWFWSNSLCTS